MDTYLAFHRDRIDGNKTPGGGVREHHHSHHHHHHPKRDQARSPKPAAERVSEKPFSPTFPSLHDLTDDRHNGNYRHHSPENSPYPMGRDEPSDEALNKFRTANTVTITPELFEKMYLSPQNQVKGDLRQTFGNPTPLALLGFLLSLSPLSCELMGWRGAGVDGIATVGAYYFIGGFLMSLGGILEFFLGNTFSFVVFCSFGGFWFTLGATLTPAFNAYGAYSTDAAHPELGLTSPSFHASYGFFLLFMGLMSFIYLICALRTNLIFVAIFAGLLLTFVVLTGSYWALAAGNKLLADKLQVAAGAFGFLAVMAGWWIFFAQMLNSVDFPLELPVGDISHLIVPLSARREKKKSLQYPA